MRWVKERETIITWFKQLLRALFHLNHTVDLKGRLCIYIKSNRCYKVREITSYQMYQGFPQNISYKVIMRTKFRIISS